MMFEHKWFCPETTVIPKKCLYRCRANKYPLELAIAREKSFSHWECGRLSLLITQIKLQQAWRRMPLTLLFYNNYHIKYSYPIKEVCKGSRVWLQSLSEKLRFLFCHLIGWGSFLGSRGAFDIVEPETVPLMMKYSEI